MADGSLVFDTKIDSAGFSGGLKRLGVIGVKATAAVTAGLAAVSGYAVKMSIDFESAFAGVKKTVEGTDTQLSNLRQGILDMSKELPASASEIAGVAEAAGQLGIQTDNILDFTRVMIDLGESTNLTSEQAATSLARLANIMKTPQTEFSNLGSTIVALGNNLATTESEIVEMGLRIAGTGSQIGLTESQVLGLAGAMSSVGINAEAGGSSISRVMQKINTEVLSAGDNLSSFAALAGRSAEDFANLWKSDPQAALVAFADGLGDVKDQGGSVAAVLKDLGIKSIMEIDTLSRLSGNTGLLKDALGIANASYEDNNALQKEAAQRYETTASKIEILKNNVGALAIAVGDGMKESLAEFIDAGLSASQQLYAAFEKGGLSGLTQELGSVLADAVNMITEKAPDFVKSAVAMIQSFIQGISDNLPQLINSAIQIVATLGQGLMTALPMLAQLLFDGLTNIFNAISDNSDAIVGGVGKFVVKMADLIIANLPTLLSAGINMIVSLGKSIIGYLPQIIEIAPRLINDFANAIYSQIPTLIKAAFDLISALAVGLVKAIPVIIKNLPQIIMAIINVITLFNWASAGKSIIQGLGNGMSSLTGWLRANAGNIIKSAGEGFLTVLKNLPTIAKSIISALANGLKGNSGSILQTIKNIALGMIKSFVKMLPKFASVGKDIVKGIITGLAKASVLLISKMTELAKSAWSAVKNFFGIKSPSRLMRDTIGKPIVQGIAVGINAEQQTLNDSIIDMSDEALKIAKEKAGNYKEIGKIYSEKMAKGIEKSVNQSIDAVKKLVESTIPEANKNNKKAVAEYKKAGKEVATAYAKSIKDGISKVKEEISAEVEKITQEAQKQYDSVIAKQQEMEQKLAGFGDLFVIDDESQQATLENINDQISAIKRYDEVLTSLRDKGAGDAFLGEVTKLGVKEGTKFGEALLKLSDAQFKTYQSNWEEKQKLAKEVAMKFYKDQLDAIQSDFVNRLDSTLKTVPATVKSVGVNAIEGMIVGMDSRKQGAVSKAREIADAVISEMQRAMDIHSPSRVMRDLIGKNIVRGVEEGITDEQHNMLQRMRSAVESAKGEFAAIATARTNNAGGKQIITNNDNGVQQTVNFYQPVKSAVENAREMKRAAKEMAYGY